MSATVVVGGQRKLLVDADLVSLAVLVAVASIMRAQWIGDPLPHLDEQFYLLVADRMWHGALPYVDIWDRKPIGLFLLYAAFRPFSPHGIVSSQLAAAAFAVSTAFVIMRIGLRLGDRVAATAAGVAYLVTLAFLDGNSGQSPVFYNLFVALAVLLVVRMRETPSRDVLDARSVSAMLLLGFAIQVKYTAAVEGAFLGVYLLWLQARSGAAPARTCRVAVALATTAMLPTIAVAAFYALDGHWGAFVQANLVSIFQTRMPPNFSYTLAFCWVFSRLVPLLALAAWSTKRCWPDHEHEAAFVLCLVWAASAIAEALVLGRVYTHYALPAVAALSAVAVPALRSRAVAIVVIGSSFLLIEQPMVVDAAATVRADRRHVDAMVAAMAPYTANGCLYLRDGPSTVYLSTGSCLPTPYVFPHHLVQSIEARAVDADGSMRRLVAGRPSAIALSDRTPGSTPNLSTAAILQEALTRDYHLKTIVPEPNGRDHQRIYVRNDLD